MSDCPTPQRREDLRQARRALFKLPRNEWVELAGHPTVYYELRDYREHPMGKEEGVRTARSDINFMFKAFETGQVRFCVLRQHLAFLWHFWPLVLCVASCQGSRVVLPARIQQKSRLNPPETGSPLARCSHACLWDALRPRAASVAFKLKGPRILQTRPPRGRKTSLVDAPRIATIHEYLDWTVTAEDALGDNELVRDTAPAACASSSAGRIPLMRPVQPAHPVTAVRTDTTTQL